MTTPSAALRQKRSELFNEDGLKARHRKRPGAKSSSRSTASEAAAMQESLARTQKLLQAELERTANLASALDSDGQLLQETMEDQQTMDVKKAKKALGSLERAQLMEQRILALSIGFFWIVVFYVLWCRLFIRVPFVDRILDLVHGAF